jgi:hypothetical protein
LEVGKTHRVCLEIIFFAQFKVLQKDNLKILHVFIKLNNSDALHFKQTKLFSNRLLSLNKKGQRC